MRNCQNNLPSNIDLIDLTDEIARGLASCFPRIERVNSKEENKFDPECGDVCLNGSLYQPYSGR